MAPDRAPLARRDDEEYVEDSEEAQRSERGPRQASASLRTWIALQRAWRARRATSALERSA